MTALERFDYGPLSASIRVVRQDDQPMFVLGDLAKALGYRDASNAKSNLRDSQLTTAASSIKAELGVRGRSPYLVTESGVYRLALRSRKTSDEVLAFQDWVTDEVLPALRTKGFYLAPGATEKQLLGAKKEIQQRIIRLEERKDYRNILNLIKKGGAQDGRDYADVQNHIYMRCFGMTARTLRIRQPQIDKPGWEAGKNHLTDAQLKLLGNVVLGVQADLGIRHPEGDAKLWEIHAAIDRVTQR